MDRQQAEELDRKDPLKHFRNEFIFPSKTDLKSRTIPKSLPSEELNPDPCIYLCGNSLGLQPRRTAGLIKEHLSAWATKGVFGHFFKHDSAKAPPFLDVDEVAAKKMAPLVGAGSTEVAVMETLTANLHLMMASFYKPTQEKNKIIIESKAFPSDHYAVYSQIVHHGFDPEDALVTINPDPLLQTLSTSQVISVIDKYADVTALILLPGIQYYTGQLLDIETITKHAHSKGLIIGWDLAHAVGNVELQLHDWDVDFAAWCTYKYLNSGPGAIASLFVHEKHGIVEKGISASKNSEYRPRLSGWWGGDKSIRFEMGDQFNPIPGAAGFQVGNPCALALTAVLASLEVFEQTTMHELRTKSLYLTGYLEKLLHGSPGYGELYNIITPSDPGQRGAQLSVRVKSGTLEHVLKKLEADSVVIDERRPDVIRVAPAPLYNSYMDVWQFVHIFESACQQVKQEVNSR